MSQRYLYLRDFNTQNRRPIGCLIVELNREHNEIRYAFSACSPLDKFNKKIAKNIAENRLAKHPSVIKGIPGSSHEITQKIMRDIVVNHQNQSNSKSRSYLAYEAAIGWIQYSHSQKQINAA